MSIRLGEHSSEEALHSLSIVVWLPFSHGHFPGTQYRFQQVVQDGFLTSKNVDYRSHAGNYLQRAILGSEIIPLGSYLDQVKTLTIFIGYGIGTDMFEFSRQSAVACIVVGS